MTWFGDFKKSIAPSNGAFSASFKSEQKTDSLLSGEERPGVTAMAILILVTCLHLWLAAWLAQRARRPKTAPPKIVEIAIINLPAEKPASALPPAAPATPLSPPVKKPVVKKSRSLVKKSTPSPKPELRPKPQPSTKAETRPKITEAPPAPAPHAPNPAVNSRPAPVHNPAKAVFGVIPLVRVPPHYPSRALKRHIEGWVKIEFTITASGQVANPTVIAAEPSGIFNDEALAAIAKWKFREKRVDGAPVEQRAVQTLQFRLAD